MGLLSPLRSALRASTRLATASFWDAPAEEGSEWPDETSTGASGALIQVPAQATSGAGWVWHGAPDLYLEITADDAVIENLDVNGSAYTNNQRVIVSNCIFRYDKEQDYSVGIRLDGSSGSIIQDCTFENMNADPTTAQARGIKCIWIDVADDCRVLRCDISGGDDGIYIAGLNAEITGNYIHDLCPYDEILDPHQDGIQIGGTSTGTVISGNNIELAADTSSAFTGDTSTSITVTGNRLRAGGHVLRIHDEATNVYTDNRIYREAGEGFSYIDINSDGTGSATVTGNVDDETGAAIVFP